MISKSQILEREKRWTLITGIASVMGVAIILATFGDSSAAVHSSTGLADRLREIEGDHSSLILASIGQFIGWALLAIPLVFLLKAAAARAPQVRSALVVAMIAAPLLIGLGSLISAGSIIQASNDFKDVDQASIDKCVSDKVADQNSVSDSQRKDFATDCEDEEARDMRGHTSLAPLETVFGLVGLIGFTVSVIYVALWTMRTGLLSRFWGSLGIALGAVFAFFTLFTLIWFIYLGLLLAGWVPGGRPPAWAAGEARPWPKPGDPRTDGEDDVIEGSAEEVDPSSPEASIGDFDPDGLGGIDPQDGRRKRKKRS